MGPKVASGAQCEEPCIISWNAHTSPTPASWGPPGVQGELGGSRQRQKVLLLPVLIEFWPTSVWH